MDNDKLTFKEDASASVCSAIEDLCDAIRSTPAPVVTVAQGAAPNVNVPTTVNIPETKQPVKWVFSITSRDGSDKIREITATPHYR